MAGGQNFQGCRQILLYAAIVACAGIGFSSCQSRDKEPPELVLVTPAFDGLNVQYGGVMFVQFTATDNQADGGIWKVELRKADGVTVRTSQIGLWQGSSIDTLVVPFALDATSWPSETMTLAVIVDDAAGNRSAEFRDFNYTAAADVPSILVALTQEPDDSSSLLTFDDTDQAPSITSGLPLSHDLAYASDTYALADATNATVHLIDRQSMAIQNTWSSGQSEGTAPLIKRIHALGLQAGFTVVHASGIAIINPSGGLLFERFSEAPWSPIDARFSDNTCVLWERNEATSNHRLRSWDFVTGASGPIVNLAVQPAGLGMTPDQNSGSPGTVFAINEATGVTLIDLSTGVMNDLCGLIGSGNLSTNDYLTAGFGNEQALFVRESQLCRQDIGPVSSGSTLPIAGEIIDVQSRADGSAHMLIDEGNSRRLLAWSPLDSGPVANEIALPINTKAIWLVSE
jgi:hypothetical protein